VRGLLADYYATPDTWPVTRSLDRTLKAINGRVPRQASVRSGLAGMATTLTTVILRGALLLFRARRRYPAVSARRQTGMASTLTAVILRGGFYYFAHVGDTRLYLLRGGKLTRLRTDHVWDRPEMQHVPTRAIGLDSRLAIDHGMDELRERDVFLLASDGVWAAQTEYDICSHLAE